MAIEDNIQKRLFLKINGRRVHIALSGITRNMLCVGSMTYLIFSHQTSLPLFCVTPTQNAQLYLSDSAIFPQCFFKKYYLAHVLYGSSWGYRGLRNAWCYIFLSSLVSEHNWLSCFYPPELAA